MTKIISFCNIKGGTGKTTGICQLAYYLRLIQGRSVSFIDCDRQNLSGYSWLSGSVLEEFLTKLTKVEDEEKLFEELKIAKKNSEFVLIDTQSGLNELHKTVISVSDVIVIPLQPHLLDLDSSLKVVRYINNVKAFSNNDKPQILSFLNRCVPNTHLALEAEEYMRSQFEEIFIPIRWHNRQIYADLPVQKRYLFCEGMNPKAMKEVLDLCTYIYNYLEGGSTNGKETR